MVSTVTYDGTRARTSPAFSSRMKVVKAPRRDVGTGSKSIFTPSARRPAMIPAISEMSRARFAGAVSSAVIPE